MDPIELKSLLEKQGEAFDAFKKSHDEQIAELKKLGANDPVLTERLGKIESSLDAVVEAKAKLEAGLEAERKEREDFEARLQRFGVKGDGDGAKLEVECKTFNERLASAAADRKKTVTPLDLKGYEDYKAAFGRFLRNDERQLSPDEVKTLSVGSDPDGGYVAPPELDRMIEASGFTRITRRSPMFGAIQSISAVRA